MQLMFVLGMVYMQYQACSSNKKACLASSCCCFTDVGQVAIFDATNSTQERRDKLSAALRGRVRFIFIENICNDPDILRQNYMNKMLYSPDYQGVSTEEVSRCWLTGAFLFHGWDIAATLKLVLSASMQGICRQNYKGLSSEKARACSSLCGANCVDC
eukprot:GHRR01014101.1.p1 GENE.GHRR01014101.1~~GHRR01014101.1.p1  ORF type:complete len:158 (-),score=42.94 GHRR01014101.1:1637-2110(-)